MFRPPPLCILSSYTPPPRTPFQLFNTGDAPSPDIQRTIDFIQANICDEIPLEDLADEAGLSLFGFNKKFLRQIGMPPRMFINLQKVEKARELLTKGKSVTDTAFDMGFNSSTYFATVFRKFTLMSPNEFARKKQRPES